MFCCPYKSKCSLYLKLSRSVKKKKKKNAETNPNKLKFYLENGQIRTELAVLLVELERKKLGNPKMSGLDVRYLCIIPF